MGDPYNLSTQGGDAGASVTSRPARETGQTERDPVSKQTKTGEGLLTPRQCQPLVSPAVCRQPWNLGLPTGTEPTVSRAHRLGTRPNQLKGVTCIRGAVSGAAVSGPACELAPSAGLHLRGTVINTMPSGRPALHVRELSSRKQSKKREKKIKK